MNLETSWASHSKPDTDDFFLTLRGIEGSLELYVPNYATENTLTLYTEVGAAPVVTRPALKSSRTDHEHAVAEFIRCIKEDAAPTATVEQGLTVMRVIEAVYQSAELGQEVRLG
jgi:predicted dehydrogenase